MLSEIEVSGVEKVVINPSGCVVVKAIAKTARLGESSTKLEIAMDPSVAVSTAIALLVTAATARAENGVGQQALQVLAAAVVASGSAEKSRFNCCCTMARSSPSSCPSVLLKC